MITYSEELPLALARLHGELAVGAELTIAVDAREEGRPPVADIVVGAGFEVEAMDREGDVLGVRARRARTLPDTVAGGMRLLVCGLNPSLVAADAGFGYAGPTNRFWPAAVEAGMVTRRRDPDHALRAHGVGMTDLVKRATPRAEEVSPEEYRAGAGRVARLVGWLRPGAVLFVGLSGWQVAVDRRAAAGPQPGGFAGVPAYVMPSTSGLNAHSRMPDLVAHMRAALTHAGPRAGR